MKEIPKIRVFFIIVLITLAATSCNKKNDVIPDVTVDFTFNINDPQFIKLISFGESVLVDRYTNNWGHYSAGYAQSGIIVTRGVMDGEFFAYDRTCPHDYALTGSVIKVNLDPTGFAKAKCPQCGTTYELTSFGTPASGVGRYPLKNYQTSFDGLYVRIWNSY